MHFLSVKIFRFISMAFKQPDFSHKKSTESETPRNTYKLKPILQ